MTNYLLPNNFADIWDKRMRDHFLVCINDLVCYDEEERTELVNYLNCFFRDQQEVMDLQVKFHTTKKMRLMEKIGLLRPLKENCYNLSIGEKFLQFFYRSQRAVPDVIKRNFKQTQSRDLYVPEFNFTKTQWQLMEIAYTSSEHVVNYMSPSIFKKFHETMCVDNEWRSQALEGFCYLHYKNIDLEHSFQYESDGFSIELLQLKHKFCDMIAENREWHPRFCMFSMHGVSLDVKMFGVIMFTIASESHIVLPVYNILFHVDMKEVTHEFEKRALKHEREIRVIKVDFSHASPGHPLPRRMFTRFVFLLAYKKQMTVFDEKYRSLPVCVRNCFVRYSGQFFRVTKVKTQAYKEALNLINMHTNAEQADDVDDDVDDDDDDDKQDDAPKKNHVQFYKPIIKNGIPALYFIYDVETQFDSLGSHYVYLICVEYFYYDPTDTEYTIHTVETKTFFLDPFTCQSTIDMRRMQDHVVTQFLQFIVQVVYDDLESSPLDHWKSYVTETRVVQQRYLSSPFYLNVRVVGFNSSNYDDKFLIPYVCDTFKPHRRVFSKRGQTVNKHIITMCEVMGPHKERVKFSFQDIMRFLPEAASLKAVCENLSIPIPKIDFKIVEFNRRLCDKTITPLVDIATIMSLFGYEVNREQFDARSLNYMQKVTLKKMYANALNEFQPYPTDIYSAIYDIRDILQYYCQRDVTATRIITHMIVFRFRRVLTNMYNTRVEGTEQNFTDYFKHIYSERVGPGENEDYSVRRVEKIKVTLPIEMSSYVDIMEYMSVAQISYTFIKILCIAKHFDRLNGKNVELLKFIKTAYFGGVVHHSFVGLYENVNWQMIDVKSEYPLTMTGPLPIFNDAYTFKLLHDEADQLFLQEQIDNCKFFRDQAFSSRTLHLFKPHAYIKCLFIALCKVTPPKSTQASIFSPLPFAEQISQAGARACRYFTVPQTRVISSHHICALILQGWTVTIRECEYNICFNVLRVGSKHMRKGKQPIRRAINNPIGVVMNDEDDFCFLSQFVDMFGKAKATAADEANKVDKKLYKMILNAGAGRLGMKDVSRMTNVDFELNESEERTFHANKTSDCTTFNKSNFEWAVFINSAALYVITRAQYLLQLKDIYEDNRHVWERHTSVAYTDTDSVLFALDHVLPEVYASFIMSNEIGRWKDNEFLATWSIKSNCDACAILGKKSYFLLKRDAKGLKDVAMHSKGMPTCQVLKKFYDANLYMREDVLKELLDNRSTPVTFNGIFKRANKDDLSYKTFENKEFKKKINVTKCGFDPDLMYATAYSFLPSIPSTVSPYLTYTHSPCSYLNCPYCDVWYLHIAQSINYYNYNYDRLL
jgi:hypothetical protein